MSDRASELRAIADGRLMLHVRNGVTVARSMLARIADEFETMSTALAAKDAELAEARQRYVDANEARIDAEAQLAEARKVLEQFAELEAALKRIANVVGEDEPSIMWPWAQEIARSALQPAASEGEPDIAEALRTVEREAYERAAKIADAVHDENSDPYAKASAASVALRIRALGKDSGS